MGNSIAWYSSPFFTTMLGALVGGGISFLAAWIIFKKQQERERIKELKADRKTLWAVRCEVADNVVLILKSKELIDFMGIKDENGEFELPDGFFDFGQSLWEIYKVSIYGQIEDEDIEDAISWFYYQSQVFNKTKRVSKRVAQEYENSGMKVVRYLKSRIDDLDKEIKRLS